MAIDHFRHDSVVRNTIQHKKGINTPKRQEEQLDFVSIHPNIFDVNTSDGS